jgi:hypothetical protein
VFELGQIISAENSFLISGLSGIAVGFLLSIDMLKRILKHSGTRVVHAECAN